MKITVSTSILFLSIILLILSSCQEKKQTKDGEIIKAWRGKELKFPSDAVFTVDGTDTIDYRFSDARYKIVSYTDSAGCTSCNLKLTGWIELYRKLEASNLADIPIVLYVHPKESNEIFHYISEIGYHHPICVDINDSFNKANHLPTESPYQTFLLDKENKVLMVGNPIHNPQIKALFLSEMDGEDVLSKTPQTTALIDDPDIDMGDLKVGESKECIVKMKNTGNNLLVIHALTTSCGCISAEYPKEPVRPGDVAELKILYRADTPNVVMKTITVYANTQPSMQYIHLRANVNK